MPELPDVVVYIESLERRLLSAELLRIRVLSPFVLRTFDPTVETLLGRRLESIRRIGKRIVFDFGDELFLVIHLMIAGRFRWFDGAAKPPGKISLALLEFSSGTLVLTEAGSKKRASMHVVRGESALREIDRGGVDVLLVDEGTFRTVLRSERHTLKRSLTDPRLFSGIGNAYSDEILHRAKLSPIQHSTKLTDTEVDRLYSAMQEVLLEWIERFRAESRKKFPEKVTAFRPEMAVHGKFGKPCPVCQSPVQRIVYSENETNYCAQCQTGGRLLADRALSRLLREDWPRSIEEMEEDLNARR